MSHRPGPLPFDPSPDEDDEDGDGHFFRLEPGNSSGSGSEGAPASVAASYFPHPPPPHPPPYTTPDVVIAHPPPVGLPDGHSGPRYVQRASIDAAGGIVYESSARQEDESNAFFANYHNHGFVDSSPAALGGELLGGGGRPVGGGPGQAGDRSAVIATGVGLANQQPQGAMIGPRPTAPQSVLGHPQPQEDQQQPWSQSFEGQHPRQGHPIKPEEYATSRQLETQPAVRKTVRQPPPPGQSVSDADAFLSPHSRQPPPPPPPPQQQQQLLHVQQGDQHHHHHQLHNRDHTHQRQQQQHIQNLQPPYVFVGHPAQQVPRQSVAADSAASSDTSPAGEYTTNAADNPHLRHPHDPRLLQQAQAQAQAQLQGLQYFPVQAGSGGLYHLNKGDQIDLVSAQARLPQAGYQFAPAPSQPHSPHHQPHHPHGHQFPSGPALPDSTSVNQPFGEGHHPSFHHSPHPLPIFLGPNGLWVPLMAPELSILNAESFDDGTSGFRAPRSLPPQRTPVPAEPIGFPTPNMKSRSGKRGAQRSASAEDPEEPDKKRSRGRPKLETPGQTPKDRRREQIRLAQRAYRERKETAIQTLEKQVEALRHNTEQMSNSFMKLYDVAVSQGLHQSNHEFGRQLQATADTFVALARTTNDDGATEVAEASAVTKENESEPNSGSPRSASDKRPTGSVSPGGPGNGPKVHIAGVIVSHEPDMEATYAAQSGGPALVTSSTAVGTAWSQGSEQEGMTPNYEIISQPTMNNASFPFV